MILAMALVFAASVSAAVINSQVAPDDTLREYSSFLIVLGVGLFGLGYVFGRQVTMTKNQYCRARAYKDIMEYYEKPLAKLSRNHKSKLGFVFIVLFCLAILILPQSASAVDTTYLITYMRFEEGSGTLTNDTRGIQNMTFGGTPAWTGGKVGNNAIQYNSVDDRITAINTYHEYPNNFTICYWGYTTAFGTGRNFYLFSGNQSATYWAWAMYDTSGTGELIYRKGATDSTAVADTTTGGWNFYCAAKNDTTVVVYKNNATTLATLTGAVSGASAGMNLTIGGDITASTGYNGKIDEVSIWNKPLNSSEVRDVYNFGAANQTISSVFPPTVSFQGQTPVSGSVELANGSNAVTVNLSVSNLGGMSGLDLYLYNLTGSLRAQYYYQANASDLNGLTQSFDTKNISGYVINATVHNFTNAIIFDDSGNGRNLLTLNSPEINSSCGFSGNGFCSLSATALIGKGANISYNMVSITDSNDFSLGGWFKINSCDTNASHSNMGGIGKNFLWGINFVGSSGGKCYPAFSIRNLSGSTITTIANTSYNLTSDNDGAFINATYNATSKEMRLYIDGELHANGTKNALITINSTSASKYFGFGWSYFVTGGNGVNGNYSADNLFFSNGTNTYTWSFDSVGYPYNASSESRTFYTYNVSVGGITSPANASALSNRYQNVSWSNGTLTPSGVPVNVSYSTLFLYNSSFGFVKILANTTNLNLTNWDLWSESLNESTYYLKINQTDTSGNTATNGYTQINLATVNIRVKNSVDNSTINSYTAALGYLNLSTTNGNITFHLVLTNYTVALSATGYLNSNETISGLVVGENNFTYYMDPVQAYYFIRESDNTAFNVSGTIQTKMSYFCVDTVVEEIVTSSTMNFSVPCVYDFIKVDVNYGNTSYYRIVNPDYVPNASFNIYLLDLNVDTAVERIISLKDLTGEYTEGEIYMLRYVNETQVEVIRTPFDIETSVDLYLLKDAFYIVGIENNAGSQRVLGNLIASNAGTSTLTLPGLSFYPDTSVLGNGLAWNYSYDASASSIQLYYYDAFNLTESLTFRVYNETDGVVFQVAFTQLLNDTTDITISYTPLQDNNKTFYSTLDLSHATLGVVNETKFYDPGIDKIQEEESDFLSGLYNVIYWIALVLIFIIGMSFDARTAHIGLAVTAVFFSIFTIWGFISFGPATGSVTAFVGLIAVINLITNSRKETGGD